MNLFDYLIPFALALGILIVVHEFGHYWVARRAGVKVLRFSIGFGKPLFKWRAGRDQTEWAIGAFPLGGYVKMLDEREGVVAASEAHRAFNRASVWRRIAIVVAGPMANFLLAVVLYWGLMVNGSEELVPRVQLSGGADTAAAMAGLQNGDLVTGVDGNPVRSWQDLRWQLVGRALDRGSVNVAIRHRDGSTDQTVLDLARVDFDQADGDVMGQLGISPYRPPIAPIVGQLVEGGPAEKAGFHVGDRIRAVNGKQVSSWSDFVELVRHSPGVGLAVTVKREDGDKVLSVVPSSHQENTAKRALSEATARSHIDTSWQPAAVAMPCTRAITGCGID